MRILICGLNGTGKTTLGSAVAERLGWRHIDSEELFFDGGDYSHPRGREAAVERLETLARAHRDFVLSSVKGDYAEPFIDLIFVLNASKEIRLQRLTERSIRQFGSLNEREQRFLAMAAAREEKEVNDWLNDVTCPVIRLDGTLPLETKVSAVVEMSARNAFSQSLPHLSGRGATPKACPIFDGEGGSAERADERGATPVTARRADHETDCHSNRKEGVLCDPARL